MLNVGALREGYVLDHIKAGKAMTIYHDLKLDKLDCTVAIIKNARSNKMGKKDIIKVECPIEDLDLDILGFIDHNITVNIIKDTIQKMAEKKQAVVMNKITFGAKNLPEEIEKLAGGVPEFIELVGLCTDICVISNSMLLKAFYPEVPISVDASACAGVTPQSHKNALEAMKMCQIDIVNE